MVTRRAPSLLSCHQPLLGWLPACSPLLLADFAEPSLGSSFRGSCGGHSILVFLFPSHIYRRFPPHLTSVTMNPSCARCGKIVYPTEKVNCLDKYWHKACFHCEVCKMTLNMKNYKGYEKKPYCNVHYPKQSFTMVADTPENLRLKQQSELQSQVRYKEEFEKNKGKGFSVVADTPELQRIKKTQDQISNIKYHEEFEKSKMGAPGGEGGELERCNSQEGANYRRTVEQPPPSHQQPHHAQPSNLGNEQEERDIVVYHQQSSQQPASQSCGYKEPAAPVSIQHSAPTGGGKRFRAVYDYSAADEDEVSFQDGDTIINVQQIDDGWMYGTVERTGDTGMLPANYVEAM